MLRELTAVLASNLVELLMFSVGLRARTDDVIAQVRQPNLLFRELFVLGLAVPILAVVVVRIADVPPPASVLFVLFAICPAAPYVLRSFQKSLSAEPKALAVVGLALAASVVIVPSWVAVLNRFLGFELQTSVLHVGSILVLKVFLPLTFGMLVRKVWRTGADRLGRVVGALVVVALVVSELLLFTNGFETLRTITPLLVVVALVLASASALLGELAGGQDPELREILGTTAVSGNPSLALAVVIESDPTLKGGALLAAYLLCRALAAIPYKILAKRRRSKRRAAPRPYAGPA